MINLFPVNSLLEKKTQGKLLGYILSSPNVFIGDPLFKNGWIPDKNIRE